MDVQKSFFEPVIDTVPELRKEYLAKIARPMDFQTIVEEEIPQYEEISDLQEDLELMFKNCIDFNGKHSPYGNYAMYVML